MPPCATCIESALNSVATSGTLTEDNGFGTSAPSVIDDAGDGESAPFFKSATSLFALFLVYK